MVSASAVRQVFCQEHNEPFRLLLDVHLIVTLNDLVLFRRLDKHRFVGQLCKHEGAYFFAYEK